MEAAQGFQGRFGAVSDLAVDLHVMVVSTSVVGDRELSREVHRERRRAVERVRPVLKEEAIGIRGVRDVEQLAAETKEGLPGVVRAETDKGPLPRQSADGGGLPFDPGGSVRVTGPAASGRGANARDVSCPCEWLRASRQAQRIRWTVS